MSAGIVNLLIEQGATFQHRFIWQDANGNVMNLIGYTARMQIRESVNTDETLLELTTDNGRIILGGATGTIDLNIAATDTAAITWKRAVYDLELIDDDTVTRLIQGQVNVSHEVTR